MAEMNVPDKGGKGKRSKKASTRVDLTAMVDLGFLLITFFMLATTMNKPKTMEINKPDKPKDEDKEPPIKMSKTLTLMLGNNNKIYWYVAPDDAEGAASGMVLDSCDYSSTGLRRVIQRRHKEVMEMFGADKKDDLFIMIKPLKDSKLKNTVDVLDEMAISGVKRYAILEAKEDVDKIVADKVGQTLVIEKLN
jgi:biopolymer transport protein ExbD